LVFKNRKSKKLSGKGKVMKKITDHSYEIDTEAFGHERLIASYLIKGKDRTALIDPGFPSSAQTVIDKLRAGGVDPSTIDYIVLTHFHIDHSGGTGAFIRENPRAKVIIHKRSSFYVKNFAKIVGGARMVFRPELIRKFGEAYVVPADSVMPVVDGDVIDLGGGIRLKVIHTPGHSPDNVCYLEESSATLFTGDMACLQYPDLNHVFIPAGSPPLFDINDEIDSLRSLSGLTTERIMAPHYGHAGSSCEEFIDRSIEAIESTKRDIKMMFKEGVEFQHMIERLRMNIIKASGRSEEAIPGFLANTYLREMLKTGLMGFLAFLLEYAPYPRGFTYDESKVDYEGANRSFSTHGVGRS